MGTMPVNPISARDKRSYMPYRLAKSIWTQSVSNTKTSSFLKKYEDPAYTYESDLPSFGEDYGSMYGWWTTTPSGQHPKSFNTQLWNPVLKAVVAELNISKHRLRKAGFLRLSAKRSMRHLSVVELFLIQQVFQGVNIKEMIFNPEKIDVKSIDYQLAIQSHDQSISEFNVNYDQSLRLLKMYDEEQKMCAQLQYIAREGRLEEIQGKSLDQAILMDPVWQASAKIKSDNLRMGHLSFRWQVEDKQGKVQWAKNQGYEIGVQMESLERFKQRFFCVDKRLIINKQSFKVRQLFSSSCLIPLLAVVQKI